MNEEKEQHDTRRAKNSLRLTNTKRITNIEPL